MNNSYSHACSKIFPACFTRAIWPWKVPWKCAVTVLGADGFKNMTHVFI